MPPSSTRPKKSRNGVCGYVLILLVFGWAMVLWLWYQYKTVANKHTGINSDHYKHENLALESIRLLNHTKQTLRAEWTQLKHFIADWKNTTPSTATSHPPKSPFAPAPQSGIHIIFSTDCKPFMDYQTLVLFYSAMVSGHKGPVTRIVSGCDAAKETYLKTLYQKLYPQYHVHFTPDFAWDPVKKVRYVYFNKPYGLKHWLDHAEPPVGPEVIVCLIDPDMILLRPITEQIKGMDNMLLQLSQDELIDKVTRGKPVAQIYGLGAPWTIDHHRHFNRREICEPNSPCLKTTTAFGEKHFSVGPPYILHRDDMYRIADSWCRYAPKVHKQYPELLAEMYAYSIAAAHEELPHLQLNNLMVSNIHMGDDEEGWPLVDALDDVCELPTAEGIYFPGRPLPSILHFCQVYRTGTMGWAKRRPQLLDIFTCDSGLLLEPPKNLGRLNYKVVDGKMEKIGLKAAKRNAFTICVTHRTVNAAVMYYKERMCSAGAMNVSKVIKLEPVGGR